MQPTRLHQSIASDSSPTLSFRVASRFFLTVRLVVAALVLSVTGNLFAGANTPPLTGGPRPIVKRPAFRNDRILVKLKAGVTLPIDRLVPGSVIHRKFSKLGNLQVLRLPAGQLPAEAIALLRNSGLIEYAEPDYTVQALATPDDFRYFDHSLWGLDNQGILDGQPAGTVDADIDAPEAWDIRTDASSVIVAIIDTGIRATHEDLVGNLWINPGEIAGNNIDDDLNGYIDDINGINAILNNGNPDDDYGHGTHIAGTIGGRGNNTLGVVGVAWRAKMMALKFLDPTGNGSISDAIQCIDYARIHGAKVINASWGTPTFQSQALLDAITAARNADIIFVAATGNDAKNNDVEPLYPASYTLANIIAVAATTRDDGLAFFSHWGPQSVDLGAPGYNIFSCWNGSNTDYRYNDGTSMAAAMVSGSCAILRAQFPTETYSQIIARIFNNTDPLPALAGKTVTGGRLNLARALGYVPPSGPTVSAAATDSTASEIGLSSGTVTITRTGATTAALTVNYTLAGGATNGVDYASRSGTVTIPIGSSSATVTVVPLADNLAEGDETVLLTLTNGTGYTPVAPTSAVVTLADSAFGAWRFARFGSNANTPAIGGETADPDRDGLVNLVEYAFASDPNSPVPSFPRSSIVTVNTSNYLALTFARNPAATDVRWTVQASADLATWQNGSTYSAAASTPTNAITTEVSHTVTNPETIVVRDNTAMNSAGRRFLRLLVELL